MVVVHIWEMFDSAKREGKGLDQERPGMYTIQNIFPEVGLDEKTLAMQISEAK